MLVPSHEHATRLVYFVNAFAMDQVIAVLGYSVSTDGNAGFVIGDFAAGDFGMLPGGVAPENVWPGGELFNWGAPFLGAVVCTPLPSPATCLLMAVAAPMVGRRRR